MKKNETMLFAGKWMELYIIMLNKISKLKKPNNTCSHSSVESRPKIIIAMIVEHKCKRGLKG
jgi:hypothetical protein